MSLKTVDAMLGVIDTPSDAVQPSPGHHTWNLRSTALGRNRALP